MTQLLLENTQQRPPGESSFRRLPLKEIFYVLFRHKKKILLCALAGAIAPMLIIYSSPQIFRSKAKLLIRFISYSAAADPESAGQTLYGPKYWENVFNSELVILGGRPLAERTVDDLGVEAFMGDKQEGADPEKPDPREGAIQYVLDNLKISTPGRSNIIGLSFDAGSPDLAQKTLDTLVKNYLRMHSSIHRAAGSYEFLKQQTDTIRKELFATEEELKKLKNEGGIISLLEKQKFLAARAMTLEASIGQAETAMSSAEAKIRLLKKKEQQADSVEISTEQPPPKYAGDMSTLQQRLQRLRLQELELLTRYTEDSIPVRDVRSQIAVIKSLLDEGSFAQPFVGEGVIPYGNLEWAMLQEESRLSSLQAEREALQQQQKRASRDLRDLNEMERRINRLQRELTVQDATYRKFSASLEQARINQALDVEKISNISEVESATYPVKMIRRINSRKVGMLFLIGGIMSGLGLAFFTEYFVDCAIRRPRDVEGEWKDLLSVSIPRVRSASKKLGLACHGPAGRKALPAGAGAGAASQSTPHWTVPEELRRDFEELKDDLLLAIRDPSRNGSPCLLGVTSCRKGAGVSTVAASLALTIAQSGEGRVLLVDAGRSRPFQDQLAPGKQIPPGMVDIQQNGHGDTIIIQPNLYMMTSAEVGSTQPSQAPSRELEEQIRSFANSNYRFVVFDLPPVMEERYAARAAGAMDGVVLVVEAEKTRDDVMKRALEILVRNGATIQGVVLNKRKLYLPNWLYKKL